MKHHPLNSRIVRAILESRPIKAIVRVPAHDSVAEPSCLEGCFQQNNKTHHPDGSVSQPVWHSVRCPNRKKDYINKAQV